MKNNHQHEATVAMTPGAGHEGIRLREGESGRAGPCFPRPKASRRLVQGALLLLSSAAMLPAAHAQRAAPDTLAQQSLLVKEPIVVEPNLMFTLDDSGSMARNFLPETDTDQRVYAIHPDEPERYYFTIDGVLPTTDNHLLSARRRSAAVNKLYYNPEVRYLPWRNENGDPMGNADPAAAWYHQGYRGAEHEKGRPDLVTQIANLRVNLVGARPVGNLQVCADEKPDPKQKCSPMSGVSEIYPATYYDFTGPANPTQADLDNIRNYKRVSIALHSDFKRGAGRTDCRADNAEASSHTCSQAQEYQNFANWFQYHRTRMHVAIAGIGTAFAALKPDVRVGYGRINKVTASPVDNVSTKVVERGVRRFEGADRKAFFTWLKNQISDGATPLVQATEVVGEYFERKDNDGPWSSEPGKSSQKKHLSCRRSYHLLMTDGLYNFSDAYSKPQSAFRLESDNVAGEEITGVRGKDGSTPRYRYQPENPYRSATSGTLADYAMHFWKRDLRTDLVNDVPTSNNNEAFWQHLSMFTLSFGVDGTLNSATDLDALTAGTKQWPSKIDAEQPETIDDLWHAALNARGRYLNVQQGDDFVKRVGEILKEIEGRVGTIGGVSVNTQALQADNQKFVPSFNTRGWVGDVTAYRLDQNGQEQGIQWTAQEQLPAPAQRRIFVGNGANSGVRSNELVWNTALPADMRRLMITAAGKDENRDGASLVAWLRGDRKDEKKSASAGGYRERTGLASTVPLGHIVHSSPLYIGAAIDRGYALLPATLGGKDTGASAYKAFVKTKRPQKRDGTRNHAARPAQVFVGSNDGYLHAFDAETGRESYALVPHAVLSEFARSSRHDYQPRFLMDGPLVEADAYWGNAWRNLVVGTTGAGPKAVFALDVTDTRTNIPQPGLGAGSLQWELNEQDEPELGHVLHAPEIGVTRSGRWVAVFGNGYQSRSRKAQLLVVDLQTGKVVRRLDTRAGTAGINPNGLGGVKLIRDGNQVITGAYAGDLLGNLWKFDLSDEQESNWKVAFGGSALFTTQNMRPITAAPTTITHPNGGHMVLFGTGKLFHEGDDKTKDQESVYGIWDDARMVMQNGKLVWNGGSAITDERKIKRLGWATSWRDGWRGHVIVTPTAIDWQTDRGWAMTLNMTQLKGQRNIVQPQLVAGMVLFETLTPVLSADESDNACRARINTPAFNLLLDPLSGAMAEKAVIDINLDGKIDRNDPVVGGWAVEDWSGRSVVLTEPPPAPCTAAPCQAQANVVRICADGSLRSNAQNANEKSDLCFGIPSPGRWWWRELSVPDNPVAPGAVVPVEADQAAGG